MYSTALDLIVLSWTVYYCPVLYTELYCTAVPFPGLCSILNATALPWPLQSTTVEGTVQLYHTAE